MKPVKLQFSGVNSFSENTEIDFEELSRNGIFGIFGETGSGKSTILDCINFALYGNVERSKEKTDIINYKCYSAEVTFVFSMTNDGKNKLYTVKRTIKKDKNGTHKAELYEKDGENEVCIADKTSTVEGKIVEILGLNAEDFRKCIALPQGEFAQFVKSTPADRLKLIERLFSLNRYGDRLKERILKLQIETENRFNNTAGKLEAYADVSEETVVETAKSISAYNSKLSELTALFKTYSEEYEKQLKLAEKSEELVEVEKRLGELSREKSAMEELKKRLSVMPVCRELVKTAEEADKLNTELKKCYNDIRLMNGQRETESGKYQKVLDALQNENIDGKLEEFNNLAAKFRLYADKPRKLRELEDKLRVKRTEYKNLDEQKNKLKERREEAQKAVNAAETAYNNLCSAISEDILTERFKGAVLKNEYVSSLDWFARFGGDIKVFKDESQLYKLTEERINQKINEYQERILSVKDFDLRGAEDMLETLKANRQKQQTAQNNLNEKGQYLQNICSQIAVKDKELETSLKEGGDLRARADELKQELISVFGADCKDYDGAVSQNEKVIITLSERKKQLVAASEQLKTSVDALNISIERSNTLAQAAEERLKQTDEALKNLLDLSGFDSIEACKMFVSEFAHSDVEKVLSDYDAKLNAFTLRKSELLAVEGITGFEEASLRLAKTNKELTDSNIKNITGEIAVLNNRYSDIGARLKEKNKILKEYEVIRRERNVILKLKEMTRNNKFLEYIATEYLIDISSLASSTLLNLTDGRYYLVYTNNNFQVSDNYDGGNLRGVNTLSGGETFLVSLSLALALSQTICAKSFKTIEFFFLDEGFGTLDSNLLDVVMNALEKLKSSRFTIGVISHVEELKHRIESKIIVKKATETHGSSVNIGL